MNEQFKRILKMKTTIIILALGLSFAFTANAQTEENNRTDQGKQTVKNQQQPDPRERARVHTEMMIRNYDLNPTQVKRITDLNRGFYTKMYNVRNRYSNDRDYEMHRQNTIEEHEKTLKGILTNEQYEDYMHNRSSYFKDLDIYNPQSAAPSKKDSEKKDVKD